MKEEKQNGNLKEDGEEQENETEQVTRGHHIVADEEYKSVESSFSC